MCGHCGRQDQECPVRVTPGNPHDRRHGWFDEDQYMVDQYYDEEIDMSVVRGNAVKGYTEEAEVQTNELGMEMEPLSADAEVIVSRSQGDALHYIYFRVEVMETIEVYSGHFGAETAFHKFDTVEAMEEYLTKLIFEQNYIVIGGLWRDICAVSLNMEEVQRKVLEHVRE